MLLTYTGVNLSNLDIILANEVFQKLNLSKNADNKNGILLPNLFWPTARKNCSSKQKSKKFWEVSFMGEKPVFLGLKI